MLECGLGPLLLIGPEAAHVVLVIVALQDAIDDAQLSQRSLDLFAEEAGYPDDHGRVATLFVRVRGRWLPPSNKVVRGFAVKIN